MGCSFFYLVLLLLAILINVLFQLSLIDFLVIYLVLKLAHFFSIILMLYAYVKNHKVSRDYST